MSKKRLEPGNGLRRVSAVMISAFALLMAVEVQADALLLRGGEKLIGKVVSEEPSKIVFESHTLGRIAVARDRIERIERDASAEVSTNQVAAPASDRPPAANQFLPWTSAPAGSEAFDWIQLKSGEWLAGKIKSLQEEKLEFDSEKLNFFTFDWEDILTLRSARLNSVRVENHKPVDGTLLVTTNEVQIITDSSTNTYPRAELLAITPTGNRELDKWSGQISVGVSFRAGNTRQVDVNTHATLQRRTPDTRLYLDYLGNYGKLKSETTSDNHLLTGQFDYFLSRRLYVRLPDVQYFRDTFQDLEHSVTVGAGVGYDIIKTPRTEWNVTASPSWQRNWYETVPSGDITSADSAALVFETRFDTELTQRIDFIFKYRAQLSGRETGNSKHHAETTLQFEVHKRLKLDVSFVWDHISNPQTESDQTTPISDDFKLITSLGIDF